MTIYAIHTYDSIQYVKIEGKYHSNPFEILNVFKIGKVSVIHWRSFALAPVLLRPQVKTRFGWHLFKLEYRTGFDVDKATEMPGWWVGYVGHEVKMTLILDFRYHWCLMSHDTEGCEFIYITSSFAGAGPALRPGRKRRMTEPLHLSEPCEELGCCKLLGDWPLSW